MVFGFFGRNKAATENEQNAAEQVHQLRTPSPSASMGTAPPQSPDMLPVDSLHAVKRSRSMSPGKTTKSGEDIRMPPVNSDELLALVKAVPPKILHDYVVKHLPNASLQEVAALTEFFATLSPPPSLHCVRCHKDFVEVENTDWSCLVPHDDESAEVEHVGGSKKSTYETLWGCCNRLVEGNGDQGPPDGWCYEGKHTTDRKRARFRADSTLQDDKLISCRRKRCFAKPEEVEGRARSKRSVATKNLAEVDEDIDEEEEEDFDERELVREANALADENDLPSEGKGKKKAPGNIARSEKASKKRKCEVMEVEGDAQSATGSASKEVEAPSPKAKPKGKVSSMKAKPSARGANVDPVPPPQGSEDAVMMAEGEQLDNTMQTDFPEPQQKPKKPRKSRKSAAADGGKYVPPKVVEESSDHEEEDDKPRRKKKRKSM